MNKKAITVVTLLLLFCFLTGCGSPAPAPSEQADDPAASSAASPPAVSKVEPSAPDGLPAPEASSAPAEEPEASMAGEAPSLEAAAIVVAPSPPPELPAQNADGAIEVSDGVYRDIVSRTLMTAEALRSGEPIFDGIEELLAYSPDYVLDIQGMQMNLERRDIFFENARAGKPDDVLIIVLNDNEDAPVMVETYRYTAGTEYTVRQVFAREGRIVRKDETRSLPV